MATTSSTTTTTKTPSTSRAMTPAAARREAAERAARILVPPVDIYETDKAYVLLAEMPGVEKDGLDVECDRDTLVIRGRAQRRDAPADYQEFELGDYRRTFTLSEDLDTAGITATLKDGVLRLEIPKSPGKQPKKIPVRTA